MQQAISNSKEQFASSPDLKDALLHAIMDAFEAHSVMSNQALGSERVLGGLQDILLGPAQLYEALRARSDRPPRFLRMRVYKEHVHFLESRLLQNTGDEYGLIDIRDGPCSRYASGGTLTTFYNSTRLFLNFSTWTSHGYAQMKRRPRHVMAFSVDASSQVIRLVASNRRVCQTRVELQTGQRRPVDRSV